MYGRGRFRREHPSLGGGRRAGSNNWEKEILVFNDKLERRKSNKNEGDRFREGGVVHDREVLIRKKEDDSAPQSGDGLDMPTRREEMYQEKSPGRGDPTASGEPVKKQSRSSSFIKLKTGQ